MRASTPADIRSAEFPLFAGGGLLLYQQQSSIVRQADPYTIIPDRPRRGVIEYTVQPGDVLFAIANRFGVSPETVLWNNQDVLDNDPHKILPGTVLKIPPISGIIHTIQEGDTLESIAAEYKTTVEAIVVEGAQWNNMLEGRLPPAGSTLIVPGGQREFKGWELPKVVTRATTGSGAGAPALGSCSEAGGGLFGTGSFIWPANSHWVSGYNYSAWHRGLDLNGRLGDAVYASDSGFVVYAGWSPVGYGNLIVIDHANGWQTWYAHLSTIYVTCGQDVWQGVTIGAVGSTGNSSGPHLHFETRYQAELPNPFNVLPPP
jgi:murein DD-endopeptidase MepM/ murein hydrolase activator NlpD